MNKENLLNNIKKLCKIKGITQKELLNDLKFGSQYLQSIKAGANPTIDKIEKIADYFDVSIDYLIGRTDNPEMNK